MTANGHRIETRLDHLSKVLGSRVHRCPLCADRPATVQIYEPTEWRSTPPPSDDPTACRRCGWEPTVIHIVETVVWRQILGDAWHEYEEFLAADEQLEKG